MSTAPGQDQNEWHNGSVLCEKYIVHGKCSREPCKWKHTTPKPGEARPLCSYLKLKGGCTLGEYCKLSHEQHDATGATQNKANSLPFGSVKGAQANGRPTSQSHSEPNPSMSQPSRTGVSLGVGSDNRASTQTNNYKSPIEGMTAARRDWKQHKDAVIGNLRNERPKARGVPVTFNFNLGDGGVALGVSLSNGYDSSPQPRKAVDTHNTQYGHPPKLTPTVERIDKAVGKSYKIDSILHGSMSSHRNDFPSKNGPGNWQQSRPSPSIHRPVRDRTAMNHGPNSGSDLISRTKPIGTRNETARPPGDVRDSSNDQTRVMFHDPKFPTMTERQGGARLSPGIIHRANVPSELPIDISHTNARAPRGHEGRRHQNQEGLNHASPLTGDPGGGGGSRQALRYGVGNGPTGTGLIQGLSEGARSELKGGGVALNDFPRTNHASEHKKGPALTESSNTVTTSRDVKVETNGSGGSSAKKQEYGSQSSSIPSVSESPKGTGGGGEIQTQLLNALRKAGKMNPRAGSWSPENTRRGSTGGSIPVENRAGHSNLEGFTKVSVADDTNFATDNPIGNAFSGGRIPAGPLGNRPAASQQASTAPEKSKNLGFNETGDSEGGAKIRVIDHGENEDGGAKLPVEGNVQLELYYSQTNVGPDKSNKPATNGVMNTLRGITLPQGPKYPDGPQTTYSPRQNHHHPQSWVQGGHNWTSSVVQFRGYRFGTQGVRPRPDYEHQFRSEMGGPRHAASHYQSLGYGHTVTAIPKNVIPTNIRFDNCNVPQNTSFVPNLVQTPPRESQPQSESTFLNQGRDSVHIRLDRSTRLPPALSSHTANNLSPLYRHQSLSPQPPALFSYEASESSWNSQGIQGDTEPNRRSYTPEPEELDRSALRLYYDERRVEARASDTVWEEPVPPNRQEPPVDYNEFIKGDSQINNTQEKDPALAAELKNPGQLPKETSPMPEQSFERTLPSPEEPPKKPLMPEKSFEKTPPSLEEPPKKPSMLEQSLGNTQSSLEGPLVKKPLPILEQSFKKTPPSLEETPNNSPPTPEKFLEKTLPSLGVPLVRKPPSQSSKKTLSTLEESKRGPLQIPVQHSEKTPSLREESPKKKNSPMAEKPFGKKTPSAWEKPLVKATSPKPNRDTCWMCGRHHQRGEDEECGTGLKTFEVVKSRHGWASTIESHNDWDWRNEWNEHTNGWSDVETVQPEPRGCSPAKEKRISKGPRAAKDSHNRDKNSGGHVNRQSEGGVVEPTNRKLRKREHTQKESSPNKRVERVEGVSENFAEAPGSDGPKSVMFKVDGNHFGQYYEKRLGGVRKLSEDTLHMIFSYVADGLMPEDQMKMKNVHIGSNFRLDASFTTTRYRRLKSVLRSCRYWRHLSQHIVYKYVNLDQFCNFKGFVRTISEDAELGKMVRAIKINIQGGVSYTSHDNRLSRQELSEMPKSSDSAQLFTVMMESCPELQILSANMYGAIRGFNFVLTKFPKMREVQIMDDSSKGMVAHNLWRNLGNYPNLEKFRIFHSEENGATNFDSLKLPPRDLFGNRSTEFVLKALTMERAPELSDRILGVFASRLKQLTNLVIVDCKLVTSAGLARAIQKMPDPNQLNRLIYYVWVDPFGKATPEEMAPSKDHLCSTIREHCTNLTYLNWKPYRICGDFWKESNFRILKRCRIEPMVFKDCSKDIELRNHSKFMDAYRLAREEERLPELAEDRVVFDFYF